MHNKRVRFVYHQGTILNSPKFFYKLFESNGKVLHRRHIYDAPCEYYSHNIDYSVCFSPLYAHFGDGRHWATAKRFDTFYLRLAYFGSFISCFVILLICIFTIDLSIRFSFALLAAYVPFYRLLSSIPDGSRSGGA